MFLVGPLGNCTAWPIKCILHGINNMTVMMFSVGPHDHETAWSVQCILHGINNMTAMTVFSRPP